MQGSLSEFLVIALYGFFGVYLPHRIFKAMSPQSAVKLRLGMARDKIAGSAKTDPSFPRGARIAQGMDGGAAHESICRGEKQIKKRTQPFADDRLAAKTESFDFGKNPIRKNAAYTKFCVCSSARGSENVKKRSGAAKRARLSGAEQVRDDIAYGARCNGALPKRRKCALCKGGITRKIIKEPILRNELSLGFCQMQRINIGRGKKKLIKNLKNRAVFFPKLSQLCGNNFQKLPVERVKRLRHCKLHLRLFNGSIVTHAVSFEKKNRSCRFDGKRPDSSRLQKRRAIRHRRV